ncbi:hypothetical protein [Leptolyngbya sp. 7M]|uniref:hypothetical protein n=1 Tax=Leptolyngbya sp. 7M TaxID=2812896 RepID=UPI001B8C23FE|nr:hypothetical protein [Leptolyngbya sp. 7M]QYO64264.1 hypothetical protein JVX88_31840 [Leptolyngbya sp. 7M]
MGRIARGFVNLCVERGFATDIRNCHRLPRRKNKPRNSLPGGDFHIQKLFCHTANCREKTQVALIAITNKDGGLCRPHLRR